MAYKAEISRRSPAALVLLIDQSFSMSDPWASANASKAQALAFAVNRLIHNAQMLCGRGTAKLRDYFEMSVLGYGADEVRPVLPGSDAARPILPIGEVAAHPLRLEQMPRRDDSGSLTDGSITMPVWVEPTARGGTPMVAALDTARAMLETWCSAHPSSFPPIVINVTDADSTDGDPVAAAERLTSTATADGGTLLFNLHLSSVSSGAVVLPARPDPDWEPVASRLFEASSELPESMARSAADRGFAIEPGARGFMYNAEMTSLVNFLQIGTQAVVPAALGAGDR